MSAPASSGIVANEGAGSVPPAGPSGPQPVPGVAGSTSKVERPPLCSNSDAKTDSAAADDDEQIGELTIEELRPDPNRAHPDDLARFLADLTAKLQEVVKHTTALMPRCDEDSEDASAGGTGEHPGEKSIAGAIAWRRSLRDLRSRLIVLMRGWSWDQPLVGDAAAFLRACVCPEVDLADAVGPSDLDQVLLREPHGDGPSPLGRALSELDSQLRQLGDPGDKLLRAQLVGRRIDELFGLDGFIRRLLYTLQVNRRLLNLLPALMTMGVLRSTRTTSLAEHNQFSLLCLAHVQLATDHAEKLEELFFSTKDKLVEEQALVNRTTAELLRAREEKQAAATLATTLDTEVDRLRASVGELESERDQLRADLHRTQDRIRRLHRKVEELENAQVSAPHWTDSALEDLFRFTWVHGRAAGRADQWYSFLRAAVTGSPADVPKGMALMCTASGLDTPPGPPPPAMSTLASYRPLFSADVSAMAGLDAEAKSQHRSASKRPVKRTLPASSDDDSDRESKGQTTSAQPSPSTLSRRSKSLVNDLVLAQQCQGEETSSSEGSEDYPNASRDASTGTPERGGKARPSQGSASRPVELDETEDSGAEEAPPASKEDDEWVVAVDLPVKLYADCIKPIRRPSSARQTRRSFIKIIFQALGQVRGRSSTVLYRSMTERQRKKVYGIATQKMLEATSFYPNYTPAKSEMPTLRDRLLKITVEEYQAIREKKPWNKMFANRVKAFFLSTPGEWSEDQARWIVDVLLFMYSYREAYWTIGHWLIIPKPPKRHAVGAEGMEPWYELFTLRDQYIASFRAEATKLNNQRPGGMSQLIYSEPAIWLASTTCAWIPSSKIPLDDQIDELDSLEPIRARWSTAPERFVEALLPEQLQLLDENVDDDGNLVGWSFPHPYNSSDLSDWEALAPTVSLETYTRARDAKAKKKAALEGSARKRAKYD